LLDGFEGGLVELDDVERLVDHDQGAGAALPRVEGLPARRLGESSVDSVHPKLVCAMGEDQNGEPLHLRARELVVAVVSDGHLSLANAVDRSSKLCRLDLEPSDDEDSGVFCGVTRQHGDVEREPLRLAGACHASKDVPRGFSCGIERGRLVLGDGPVVGLGHDPPPFLSCRVGDVAELLDPPSRHTVGEALGVYCGSRLGDGGDSRHGRSLLSWPP
jgi:hypothetical protein